MRGTYLALEGIEGSGKTTVSELLTERMRSLGRRVKTVREPGGTRLGEEVRRLVLNGNDMTPWAEAALFAASRAQLAAQVVGPALVAGFDVVTDRSLYSSLAYQGAGRGLGIERVRALNLAVLGDVVPDVVIVIDVDPVVGAGRQIRPDRIGSEGIAFLTTVREAFLHLAGQEAERVHVVDGSVPPEAIVDVIVEQLVRRFAA